MQHAPWTRHLSVIHWIIKHLNSTELVIFYVSHLMVIGHCSLRGNIIFFSEKEAICCGFSSLEAKYNAIAHGDMNYYGWEICLKNYDLHEMVPWFYAVIIQQHFILLLIQSTMNTQSTLKLIVILYMKKQQRRKTVRECMYWRCGRFSTKAVSKR